VAPDPKALLGYLRLKLPCKASARLALAGGIALAVCAAAVAAEAPLAYFISPLLTGTGDDTYLLMDRRPFWTEPPAASYVIVHRTTGQDTADWKEFSGGYGAAAAHDGVLYVFHGTSYSLYRGAEYVESRDWPHADWEPRCAVSSGSVLFVLGAQGKRLTLARIAGGESHEGPPSGPAPGKVRTVLAAPCAGGLLVVVVGEPADGRLPVFFSRYIDRQPQGDWSAWRPVARLPDRSEVTVCYAPGEILLLHRDRRVRITRRSPLWYRSWSPGAGWSGQRDTGLREGPLASSHAMAGGYAQGKARVMLLSAIGGQVAEAVHDGTEAPAWQRAGRFASLPSPLGVAPWQAGLVLLVVAVLLVAVAVSLLLRRGRSCRSELGGQVVQLASWRRRAIAYLIDVMTVSLGVYLVNAAFPMTAGAGLQLVSSLVPYIGYFLLLESVNGQTLGKAAMEIAVVGPDGARAPVLGVLCRSLLRVVEGGLLAPLGLVVLLNTRRQQRLGDLVGRTYVVSRPRRPEAP